MLEINDLTVQIDEKEIISGLDLTIPTGEIHIIMGPNGSGKSTLSKTIMGFAEAAVTDGKIKFEGKDVTKLNITKRAHLGIFLANQYPVEIPGVNLENFLRLAYNSNKSKPKQLSPRKFKAFLQKKLELLGIDEAFIKRNLNEGFSGGEKKKCEILQMAILQPKLAILDETDSGLDLDALQQVFKGIMKIKEDNLDMTVLIITHYERIFKYLEPDMIHIMSKGKVIKSGGKELLITILDSGFKSVLNS